MSASFKSLYLKHGKKTKKNKQALAVLAVILTLFLLRVIGNLIAIGVSAAVSPAV